LEADTPLITAADALYETNAIPDELWAKLSARLAEDQLLELVIVAGWYRLISYVINAARVELEPWAERFP
jgi:4-carboxymuconolactone decarboxylase